MSSTTAAGATPGVRKAVGAEADPEGDGCQFACLVGCPPEGGGGGIGGPPPEGREALLEALNLACRGIAAATVMFHQSVAERLGLNATDHKCGEILFREGPLTAGDLAERTGLTTGAITGVIDRLEEAGFVRRERDAADRRKVFVHPDPEKMRREIAPLFGTLADEMGALLERYSDAELALVLDFLARSRAVSYAATLKLREGAGSQDR